MEGVEESVELNKMDKDGFIDYLKENFNEWQKLNEEILGCEKDITCFVIENIEITEEELVLDYKELVFLYGANKEVKLDFINCKFNKVSIFLNGSFTFNSCEFGGSLFFSIEKNEDNNNLYLDNIKVKGDLSVYSGKYPINLTIYESDFTGHICIDGLKILGCDIYRVKAGKISFIFSDILRLSARECIDVYIQFFGCNLLSDIYLDFVKKLEITSSSISNNAKMDVYSDLNKRISVKIESLNIKAENFNFIDCNFEKVEITKSQLKDGCFFTNCDFSKAKEINLTNSFFDGVIFNEVNWGNFNIKRFKSTRDTMRSLKNNYEKIGNKIEANSFHALEMEKALDDTALSKLDKVILHINRLVSNFTQSWIKPALWYFYFVMLGSMLLGVNETFELSILLLSGLVAFGSLLLPIWLKSIKMEPPLIINTLMSYLILVSVNSYNNFNYDNIPKLTFPLLGLIKQEGKIPVSKTMIIGTIMVIQFFLIYHLQLALRKNTRK